MKKKIDGLKAVHVYLSRFSPRPLKPLNEESLKALRRRAFIRWCGSIPTMAARRSS